MNINQKHSFMTKQAPWLLHLRSISLKRALAPGARIDGPAVLEEPSATTLVPPGWFALCLPTGDLMLERLP